MYTDIKNIPPGYPTVAGLISKDDDFAIFRKFRYLNARNLLYLQAELIDLENELETLDRGLDTEQHREKLKDWKAFAADDARLELAVRIRKTLQEYNGALLQLGQVANLKSPADGSVSTFYRWMEGTQPISDESRTFLESTIPRGNVKPRWQMSTDSSELATISKHEDSWATSLLKQSPLRYLFFEDMVRYESKDDIRYIMFYPESKIGVVVKALSVMLAVALTVVAIVALLKIPQQHQAGRVGLVGVFTLLVAGVLAVSGARKAEVMMGTVGYAAVLVVFVVGSGGS